MSVPGGATLRTVRLDTGRYGARMRHLWSFLSGVVLAPLSWILISLGQAGSAQTVARWADVGTYHTANLIQGAVYLAVAGILLGLLGMLRVSPLGPLVAGLLLIAPYVGLFIDPIFVRDLVPTDRTVFGDPLPLLSVVDNGTLFLIGAMLLIATFSRQRWRRWPLRPGTAARTDAAPPDPAEVPRTDWSLLTEAAYDPDITPTVPLFPPADTPTEPLPRREGGSPWSAPPPGLNRPGGSAG